MNDTTLQLKSAPIVEAVLDIDCDLPPDVDLPALEASAQTRFSDRYPKVQKRFLQEMRVEAEGGQVPKVSTREGLQALQFLSEDGKQLVQLRPQGYSFNRLAPYTSLDDYLPEIARTWDVFAQLTAPRQVRVVRLRFINRILLPTANGSVELDQYLRLASRLPNETNLTFSGLFNRYSANEPATGNAVNITMATQPLEGEKLPIILDIEAYYSGSMEPTDWVPIQSRVQSLRRLKNLVFKDSLTDLCLNLFQQ